MKTYLRVTYMAGASPREFWMDNEIDDDAEYTEECYSFFKPNPDLSIRRMARIMRDLSMAGVQSKLVIGE